MVFVRIEIACDNNSIGEFSASESVLCLLALHAASKLDEDLAAARNLDAGHRTRDLDTADLAKPAALLPDVLENVFLLLLVG